MQKAYPTTSPLSSVATNTRVLLSANISSSSFLVYFVVPDINMSGLSFCVKLQHLVQKNAHLVYVARLCAPDFNTRFSVF